jgi:MFS transporter, DHA2 family, multidrug resistance protein
MNAALNKINPWLVASIVSVPTFMEVLDTTITNVSLTHIAGSLAASQEESTWVLTSYLVANGIILPLSGWLANALGRKRYFMLSILWFTLASLACGLATSLESLIFFRLLQGLAGGGLQPVQQSMVVDLFPPHKRGQAFAMSGIVLIAAPVIGPTLGGWITDSFDWRWIFLINVPVGLLALLLVHATVEDPPHAQKQGFGKLDFIGLGLVVVGLGALQIMLDKAQNLDWFHSNVIITLACVSAVTLVAAIMRMVRHADAAIIDLTLLKLRSFSLSCVLIFVVGFVLYGSSMLVTLMVINNFGYNSTLAGLVMSPGALVIIFLMPVSGKLVTKIQPRYMITAGMVLSGMGMWTTSHVSPDTSYQTLVWMRCLQVVGLPFLFIPISTVAFSQIPKEKSGKASALFSMCRNLGGSFGIAIILAHYVSLTQIHQNFLASHMVEGSSAYMSAMMQLELSLSSMGQAAHELAQSRIYQMMLAQASLLSYVDVFQILATMMLCAGVLTLWIPKQQRHANAGEVAVH